MQSAVEHMLPVNHQVQLHIDSGANCSITLDKKLLIQYCNIKPHYKSSAGGDMDIVCTGMRYLPW